MGALSHESCRIQTGERASLGAQVAPPIDSCACLRRPERDIGVPAGGRAGPMTLMIARVRAPPGQIKGLNRTELASRTIITKHTHAHTRARGRASDDVSACGQINGIVSSCPPVRPRLTRLGTQDEDEETLRHGGRLRDARAKR